MVEGDYIGTDSTGSHALGNGRDGVYLWADASDNVVGGLAAGAGDVISGNRANGVIIDAGSAGNIVAGDYIGTDALAPSLSPMPRTACLSRPVRPGTRSTSTSSRPTLPTEC